MQSDPTGPAGPEYLPEDGTSTRPPRSGRRTALLGAAAVAVAGVVGLGGWAAVSLMSSGSQPSEAIPADAIGYISLDLDPSASQKIDAIKMLRKFPALEKEMDISSQDDLRRWVFENMQKDGTCKDLDYESDVAPWIGDRIAMAGVPAETKGDSPLPLVALQVTDQDAASKGIAALAECSDAGEDFGVAFSGEYALMSDSTEHAESIAAETEQGTLADDADFQSWMGRVGDPGIVSFYAAPGAMETVLDMQQDFAGDLTSFGADQQALTEAQAEADRINKQLKDLYDGFSGGAGVLRFADGAVEAEVAYDSSSKALGLMLSKEKHLDTAGLPAGTAAVLGMSLPDKWGQEYLDLIGQAMGDQRQMDQMVGMVEGQTGLEIPEDIERLLGDGVAVTLDQDMDVQAASQDPTSIPAGLKISGDPQEIRPVIEKVRALLGPNAGSLAVEEGDGVVAVGLNPDYVGRLAHDGGLGADATFQDVVPEADKAVSVMYVNLDTVVKWMDEASANGARMSADDKQVRDNLEPLRAVGISSWVQGDDVVKGRMRLSTD